MILLLSGPMRRSCHKLPDNGSSRPVHNSNISSPKLKMSAEVWGSLRGPPSLKTSGDMYWESPSDPSAQ